MPRYLTKSRFKIATECPTKLFYTSKRDVYPDKSTEDSFLQVLAEGGFQVGELAKLYHPGGVEISEKAHAKALQQTADLLQQDEVVLFEPAICFENLFVRIDVLIKKGNKVDLIEVKAKSCDGTDAGQFLSNKGRPYADWKSYLEDAAFQKHVLEHAWPELEVRAFLMLVDKQSRCPTDGLHQKFRLDISESGRRSVTVTAQLTAEELAQPILSKIDVDDIATEILERGNYGSEQGLPFGSWVRELADAYVADKKITTEIGRKCADCQFRASAAEKQVGMRSGFEECWRERIGWTEEEFPASTVLDLGSFGKKHKLIAEGKYRLSDVELTDLKFGGVSQERMSNGERQWLQVQAAQTDSPQPTIRRAALREEMQSWVYPLHFIDFETSAPAIPLHAGMRPYEQLVFQYSHHLVHEDGRVEHKGQHIATGVGVFPNFEFIRALMAELDQDEGTVFRYADHENTMLVAIRRQLVDSNAPDRQELMHFIESICHPTKGSRDWATPKRDMVDLYTLVKAYYYDPAMAGSASIKKVLPAILNSSTYLQHRYAQPIYGSPTGIPSLNFENQTWVELTPEGNVRDPYELLPPLFTEADLALTEDLLSNDETLREGSAAMAAYTRMQYSDMSPTEREALQQALLRYCELDTLAMVMIYEAWREWCKTD